jgi:hypothetical protein
MGATIAFLDEAHILFANKCGLAAYDLSAASPNEPTTRLPYWKETPAGSCHVHEFITESDLSISVAAIRGHESAVHCVIFSGHYVHLAEIPLATSALSTSPTQHFLPERALRQGGGSTSTTGGILGYRRTPANAGYQTLVVRTGLLRHHPTSRLKLGKCEWAATGVMLHAYEDPYAPWDVSLDEDGGHVLLVFAHRGWSSGQIESMVYSLYTVY